MIRSEILLSGGYSGYIALYDFVISLCEREYYSNEFIDALQLSIKEAFVNAVRHGNSDRDDLTVTCSFEVAANSLNVSIMDCGKGFNPDDLANPCDFQDLLQKSGRGVHIIRSIAEIIGIERDTDGSTLMLRYIPY
jgi:anti-sigma regulatory factor (Ser/Thr protein kinase)